MRRCFLLLQLVKHSKVQIPVAALVDQLASDAVPGAVKNFTKIYLEMGWPRMPKDARVALVPKLIVGLRGRPPAMQARLMCGKTLPRRRLDFSFTLFSEDL